jgi:Protein of unknown function (DUF2911)
MMSYHDINLQICSDQKGKRKTMRSIFTAVLFVMFGLSAFGQTSDSATTCTFADGQQITVRYAAASNKRQEPQNGIWSPNGSTMFLFTETPVTLGSTRIPTGAYSLYLSGKKEWTLVVNRNTKPDAAYDAQLDVGRSAMESDQLGSHEKQMRIELVHPQPKQCSLRIFYGDKGYFAEFQQQ